MRMTPALKEVYSKAKEDVVFCEAMKLAEGCFVPNYWSDEEAKIAFAGMYLGYELKKLGVVVYNTTY